MSTTLAIAVALVLLLAVAAVLVLAMGKPRRFHVERQLALRATPGAIFPLIDDYRRWKDWSPYEDKDPAMKRSYSGPASGVGAAYAWDSAVGGVGAGRMEITESRPPSQVRIDLHFSRPFEGHNKVVFTVAPHGDGSTVTWAMDGPAPLFSRIMQVFVNLDTLIGRDFESGLARLKAVAEK